MSGLRSSVGGAVGLLGVLGCAGALAFAQAPRTPEQVAQEELAIEAGRKRGKPRTMVPRQPLMPQEDTLIRIFKAAKRSVVYISTATEVGLVDGRTGNGFAIPPGTGSGFIWDEYGHVVTNFHVVTTDDAQGTPLLEAEDLRITLTNGKTYKARVIGRSVEHDLAVLRIFAPLAELKPITLGRAEDLQVGQSVLAIGNPYGLDHTLTTGVVSALRRNVAVDNAGRTIKDAIQTDAAINPGNSGGPLLDSSGHLIGMNTAIRSATGSSSGIGFAIPVETLNWAVPQLIAKGHVKRPELGFDAVLSTEAAKWGVGQGVVVLQVSPGSPADRAGLKGITTNEQGAPVPGDIIVSFQGKPVATDVQLLSMLEREPLDGPIRLEVIRGGQKLPLVLDPRPQPRSAPKPKVEPTRDMI